MSPECWLTDESLNLVKSSMTKIAYRTLICEFNVVDELVGDEA
jgi:hypothetical protein